MVSVGSIVYLITGGSSEENGEGGKWKGPMTRCPKGSGFLANQGLNNLG